MALRRILILDTETTGLDPAKDVAIEVGAVLYQVCEPHGMLRAFSSLLPSATNEAVAVNRIPVALLASVPIEAADWAWDQVGSLAVDADAVCAHRAEFDRQFVDPRLLEKPWICTKFDVEWPGAEIGTGLVPLALNLGLGVSHAHRALTDCITLARIFDRVIELGHDLPAMLARGLRPKATFQALVSYDDREKAKAARFQWEPATKRWLRTMAIEDAAALPFAAKQICN